MSATRKFPCRHEIMDLVNASGKFSKKFEAFTGKLPNLGKEDPSKTLQMIESIDSIRNHSQCLSLVQFMIDNVLFFDTLKNIDIDVLILRRN